MTRLIKIALFAFLALLLFVIPPAVYWGVTLYRSLEAEVAQRFSGRRWNVPSRIYSDSLMVYPGQSLEDLGFMQRLARLNYHRVPAGQVASRGEYSFDSGRGEMVLFLHSFAYPYRRFSGALVVARLGRRQAVLSLRDGVSGAPLYAFRLEPELLGAIFHGNWQQRRIVPLNHLPPALIDAVLAAEDHRFFEHHGLDPVRIAKAAWVDLTSHSLRQGGSTLTQQLVKNFFLTHQRTWRRKLKEAAMAYIAERLYPKEVILENYVNDIYLGQHGQEGIYGVWEAAQYYFSKEPADLTIGEMATLAGIIRSPNRFNPLRHPERALARRNEVLDLMLRDGYLNKAACDQARAEPLRTREPHTEGNDAPYFLDFVKQELAQRYPAEVLTGEGLRIFTTLDVHTQKLAEHAAVRNLEELETRHPSLRRKERHDRLESALVAIEPQTGKVRAMVGGRDYRQSQFNRVVQAHRQPGSAFKPVTYLAALDETLDGGPQRFLPTSYIDDSPFTWEYGNLSWSPRNYKDRYFGRVTLEFALEESLNAATSRLAYAVGLGRVRAMAQKLGFGSLQPYPSIVLGGIEVTPMELARAYAIAANGGLEVEPYSVAAVTDANGRVIQGHELKARQVLSPQLAFLIDFMLEQVVDHGTAQAARQLGFRRAAAGKTGTTNDSKDAWFAGFTPDLLAVVWTGFDQKETVGLTGAQASLPAWAAFMAAATASRPALKFLPPPGIVVEKVDPLTGYLAGPYCPVVAEGAFPKGMEPVQVCPFHSGPSQAEAPKPQESPTSDGVRDEPVSAAAPRN